MSVAKLQDVRFPWKPIPPEEVDVRIDGPHKITFFETPSWCSHDGNVSWSVLRQQKPHE